VLVGEWEEIAKEPIEHDTDKTIDESNILLFLKCYSFGILSRNFEDENFMRREYSVPNN
jgi:hypothetical protein